jgi:cytochrome c peroxidase
MRLPKRLRFATAIFLTFFNLGAASVHAHEPNAAGFPFRRGAPPGAVELGQRLFFDTILSGSGRTSCASCHSPQYAWANPERTSVFDNGRIGPRNVPSLLNAPLYPRLMHDGRFGSFEEQLQGPMQPNSEMGSSIGAAVARLSHDPDYVDQFRAVFGTPPTPGAFAAALGAFERTLGGGWSRFDRFYVQGEVDALSPREQHGFALFTGRAGCVACHRIDRGGPEGVPVFTDFGYHNIGIGFGPGYFLDGGIGAITRRRGDLGRFRTPSLRNVALAPPYMHDGSLNTLYDVVEFYNHGGQPNPNLSPLLHPLGLSEREKSDLVAFLQSLTVEDYGDRNALSSRE